MDVKGFGAPCHRRPVQDVACVHTPFVISQEGAIRIGFPGKYTARTVFLDSKLMVLT